MNKIRLFFKSISHGAKRHSVLISMIISTCTIVFALHSTYITNKTKIESIKMEIKSSRSKELVELRTTIFIDLLAQIDMAIVAMNIYSKNRTEFQSYIMDTYKKILMLVIKANALGTGYQKTVCTEIFIVIMEAIGKIEELEKKIVSRTGLDMNRYKKSCIKILEKLQFDLIPYRNKLLQSIREEYQKIYSDMIDTDNTDNISENTKQKIEKIMEKYLPKEEEHKNSTDMSIE